MSLMQSLKDAGLVPGSASSLIADTFEPVVDVTIDFENARAHHGDLLRVSQVQKAPVLSFTVDTANPDASYAFMLIDPDAPTPADPKFAFWRHWVVSSLKPGQNVSGKTLTEFLAPGPKPE